ncbi:MAG: NHLP leader peptide family RiPP precursor [Pseudomonadota bacterium]
MADQSTTTTPIRTRRDLEAKVIARAWRDPAFKKRLLADPKSAVADELKAAYPDFELPEDLQIKVHEEAPNKFHLVLPRNPADMTVADVVGDDLESVAPQTIAVITGTTGVTVAANLVATVVNVISGVQPTIAAVNAASGTSGVPPAVVAANSTVAVA